MAIQFFVEDVDDIKLSKKNVKLWIKECITSHERELGDINYIFCSDEYLRNINVEYLKHDYYTDIITFNYTQNKKLSADIYISTDRVQENALEYSVENEVELRRVMIHGILHLIGLNDETEEQKLVMRKKEDELLSLYCY